MSGLAIFMIQEATCNVAGSVALTSLTELTGMYSSVAS